MPRQASAIEVNSFIAGLVTDANPLTFPDNASLEEENFVLNIDGSRRRRLGLDFEEDFQEITTTVSDASSIEPAFSTFKWDNAGGNAEQSILVIQIGTEIKFFDLSSIPISNNLIATHNFSSASSQQNFAYAVVDGILVVSTGIKTVTAFEFTAPSTITDTDVSLLIRDFFGVEDSLDGKNLYDDLTYRPNGYSDIHIYNLRNQTWALPRVASNNETLLDPIKHFFDTTTNKWPSNSDSVLAALYSDTQDTDNRTVDRFFAGDLVKNPVGNVKAPQGYFIIDALERGISRLDKEAELRANYSLNYSVNDLPDDTTPGGPTCVAEFAGRVFYAGFSGEIIDGDDRSPRMSSYILFSKLVSSVNDINRCYQEGDPTSKENPDILTTDGGFLRVNEAYGILALVNVGTSLLVCAKNGIWRVFGGSDYGFDATNYVIERVTDHGIISLDSMVVVDNTIMFWGQDGIYHVHTNEYGSWIAENITYGRIQRFYEDIPIEDKRRCKGAYDGFERKVRWIMYNRLLDDTETKELVLDINLKAYYLNAIKQFPGSSIPRVLSPFTAQPYQILIDSTDVVVNTDLVQVNGDQVIMSIENVFGNAIKEVGYVVVTQIDPVVKYSFASYRNPKWRDWFSFDDVGVDAAAFVVTGYIASSPDGGKDYMRHKQVPYLFVHSNRTETGFEEDVNGDLYPANPSSCIFQTRWEWSDSANSGKWSEPRQGYRYKRFYMPADAGDPFDTGYATVVTKNKVRGSGKVLSIKFSSEPSHDLHLYGWSMILSVAGNV